jgi:hypothetical protein
MASAASAASGVEESTSVGGPSGVSAEPGSGHLPACTQAGCIGRIVDGYCDVCGSPADPVPFGPAAASAASSASMIQDRASVGDPSGVSAEPGSGHLSACSQAGCTGTIVDGYCDVCGSPSDAVPFVSATACAAEPAEPGTGNADRGDELTDGESGGHDYRTRVEEAGLPDDVREAALCEVDKLELASPQSPESHEIGIWLDTIIGLPWTTNITESIDLQDSRDVEATLRRLIEPTVADAAVDDTVEIKPFVVDVEKGNAAAGPPAAEIVKVDAPEAAAPDVDVEEGDAGEAGPAVVAEVEEDDAGEAGPAVVGVKENHAADIEPSAVYLEEADAAEVQPSGVDVVQTDATEAEPSGVAVEEDAAEVEPSEVADVVEVDTTAVGPEHADPLKMPAPAVKMSAPAGVLSEDRHPGPQVPEEQVLEREPVQDPAKRRGFGYLAVAATALAALLIGALLFAVTRDRGVTAQSVPAVTATATATDPTTGPSNGSTNTAGKEPTIQLENLPKTARSSQTVRITGTYPRGPNTFVQAQRREGGQWLSFPYPAKTDKSGRFTTFIQLVEPGSYRLRVVDPDSGGRSETFVLVVTG